MAVKLISVVFTSIYPMDWLREVKKKKKKKKKKNDGFNPQFGGGGGFRSESTFHVFFLLLM